MTRSTLMALFQSRWLDDLGCMATGAPQAESVLWGWTNDYRLTASRRPVQTLDDWIRRRLSLALVGAMEAGPHTRA